MKEFHLMDKSEWVDGPWMKEPDHVLWIDFDSFYPCVARRNIMGAWCGYVGLAPHHPLYRVNSENAAFTHIDCHGGISFTGWGEADSKQFSPPVKLWWVGFDAMQDDDLVPGTKKSSLDDPSRERSAPKRGRRKKGDAPQAYRDLDYIRNEIGLLALQLSNLDDKIALADLNFREF